MGLIEDDDYVAGKPPHTAPLEREPRWLAWYGAAGCIIGTALLSATASFLRAGVNGGDLYPGLVLLALGSGFFGVIILANGRSKRAWVGAVLGGLGMASVVACAVGVVGPTRIAGVMCDHGSARQCSVLGRTSVTAKQRAFYDERACEGGVVNACGRLAREGEPERAIHARNKYCARYPGGYTCDPTEDVTAICSGGGYSEYCQSDY